MKADSKAKLPVASMLTLSIFCGAIYRINPHNHLLKRKGIYIKSREDFREDTNPYTEMDSKHITIFKSMIESCPRQPVKILIHPRGLGAHWVHSAKCNPHQEGQEIHSHFISHTLSPGSQITKTAAKFDSFLTSP